MNFGFFSSIPWFRESKKTTDAFASTGVLMEATNQSTFLDVKMWGQSLLKCVPWAFSNIDKVQVPSLVNKELKRQVRRPHVAVESGTRYSTVRFRPYVSKVPWHSGPRGFLSQFFPRYGHYCGPNWSSGKDGGSLLWDKRPLDWLDFCCYCHDIGYDSHDQAELLKADLAFLECLEKPNMTTKGDAHIAHLYKTMCISGLRNILIPYRENLLSLQSRQLSFAFGWLGNMKWKGWNPQRT